MLLADSAQDIGLAESSLKKEVNKSPSNIGKLPLPHCLSQIY